MAEQMIHEVLPVGWLQCNCSILGDPETREALVLDPGDDVDRILEVLARHSLTVRAIVSTHAHIDHVGGLQKLHAVTGAPVLMHGDDLDLYRHLDMQAAWLGIRPPETAQVDQVLREGDYGALGTFRARGVAHARAYARQRVFVFAGRRRKVDRATGGLGGGRPANLRRRHVICREHRPHRSLGRLAAADPSLDP